MKIAGLLLSLLLLGAGPSYRTRFDVRQFHDCYDAAAYAAAHPEVGAFQYSVRLHIVHGTIREVGAHMFRAQATLRFDLDPRYARMTLPKWSWRDASAKDGAVLQSFTQAVRNHEMGHRTIAIDALNKMNDATLSIFARDEHTAASQVQKAAAAQLSAASNQIRRSEDLYDRVTEHGEHQSDGPRYGFPGGPDITFSCR